MEEKQPEVFELFERILANDSLKHAYLFEGAVGTGKLAMSRYIAKTQLCSNQTDHKPCLSCDDCLRIDRGEHPDVIEVFPAGKGQTIKVERVRELKDEFSKSGVEGKRKIIIVDHIETMTISAANSLLKFLEEPDGDVTIFLLTANKQNILPTIISRCQVIPFRKQAIDLRIKALEEAGLHNHQAHLVAHLTQDNDEGKALVEEADLADKAEKVWRWFSGIMKRDDKAFVHVQIALLPIINDRDDGQLVLDLMMYLYRDVMQLYYQQDKAIIAFEAHRKELVNIREQLAVSQITEGITAILQAKRQLTSHVAIQGVLESLSLQLMGR